MRILSLTTVVALALLGLVRGVPSDDDLQDAKDLLQQLNQELQSQATEFLDELWALETNVTLVNRLLLSSSADLMFEYDDGDLPWSNFTDPDVIRQAQLFGVYKTSNTPSFDDDKEQELENSINDMLDIYFNVSVCTLEDQTVCNLTMDNDLYSALINSDKAEDLLYYWTSFVDEVGKEVKPLFEKYVELGNIPSTLDGYASKAEDWLSDFELSTDKIEKNMAEVIDTIKPLYTELHAWLRNKLNADYGDKVVSKTGPIPAHLLSSFTASNFISMANKYLPYAPPSSPIDFDAAIKTKDYSPAKLFKAAESFFTGLGLSEMTQTFWNKSLFEEPTDRISTCDSNAWDFFRTDDFRILHCTTPTVDSVFAIHELMILVEYYMAYAHLPMIYKSAPLPGFDDAVVLAIRRCTGNIRHLQKMGYIEDKVLASTNYAHAEMNGLFRLAMFDLSFLSYSYQMDAYRRDIFRGKIQPDEYNAAYWNIRKSIGGIAPPNTRTESGLDAAVDANIVGDSSYQSDFTSIVLEFQIFRDLCIAAGEFDPKDPSSKPLHQCDFTGSTKVGEKLSAIMSKGRSQPWYEVLKAGTGATRFDGSAIIDYFQPVFKFLKDENKKNGVKPGW